MSKFAPRTRTPVAPEASVVDSNNGMRRRNGSWFGSVPVELALATFSAAIRIRTVCARMPEAAAAMAALMSVIYLSPRRPRSHAHQLQALLVKRDAGLELHPRLS